jgi:hypothetical protein
MTMQITFDKLKRDLATVVNPTFATQLVDSYTKMQQRYYIGDWQPSELDGGQFCEAVARAIYQLDTGVVDHELLPGKICDKLLDRDKYPVPHHNLEGKHRNHFCRVLQTIDKFRSDRGVAHISSFYNANHLDAILIVANVKWLFGEFLRLALKKDHDEVIAMLEAIVQMEHPLIHELDGQPLVLSNTLTAAEEVLVLLQHASNGRLTKSELKQFIQKDQSTISRAINQLGTSKEVRISAAGEIVITPLGQTRVHETIFPKLSSTNGNKSSH